MKKIFILLLLLLTIVSMAGCEQKQDYDMSIKPSEFSEETLKVLEVFDNELKFFDINANETVKSHTVTIWVYKDGEWREDGKTFGGIEHLGDQIAINLSESGYKIFSIDENGHSTYSCPTINSDFESSIGIGWTYIDREIPIELNKEIPIWVMVGTEDGSIEVMDITEDFRNIECNAGVAVTLTISDEVVK